MPEKVKISDQEVYLADPDPIPDCKFVGRDVELGLCRAAWGISPDEPHRFVPGVTPLSFRLHGPPGVGKNEIVYQLARELDMDLYIIPGHSELTPEDLALVLVPDSQASRSNSLPLVLRASPLATAIFRGGLVFFDEINRVPERALSPLSSVLDGRQSIFSAMTGINIQADPSMPEARTRFRFCCALNPSLSEQGHVLPEYIEQRTLPVISVEPMELDGLIEVLRSSRMCSRPMEAAFTQWHESSGRQRDISVREALSLVKFAVRYRQQNECTPRQAIAYVAPMIIVGE